ncbi:MAG: hypothetical protein JXR59_04805 [Desulfuromonadaceae bacterium]|nr:hypothetical protein [Desulfuromonadaceae bacterium]
MATTIETSSLETFRLEAQQLMQNRRNQNSDETAVAAEEETSSSVMAGQDRVTLNSRILEAGLYKADMTLNVTSKDSFELLRSLVIDTFQEQGIATKIAVGDETIDLQSLTPEEAQGLISEDGYFGVDQTSQRIVDFAISMAGNDPTRFEAILAGFEDGFAEAEKAFGGTLPDISYQTRDAVLGKLNDWLESFEQ